MSGDLEKWRMADNLLAYLSCGGKITHPVYAFHPYSVS
jgi:hypothetical protein